MAQPLACLYLILVSFALFLSAYFPMTASVQVTIYHKFNSVAKIASTFQFFNLFLLFPFSGCWFPATTTSNMAAKSEKIKQRQTNNSFWKPWQVGRLVLVVIDALRADFVVETQDPRRPKIRWFARQFWEIHYNPNFLETYDTIALTNISFLRLFGKELH